MSLPRYTVTTQVTADQPYQYQTTGWCFKPPSFRCTRTKMDVRRVTQDVDIEKTRLVYECCKGYKSTDGQHCSPVCSKDCEHGTCIAPDTCKCENHFGGPTCSTSMLFTLYHLITLTIQLARRADGVQVAIKCVPACTMRLVTRSLELVPVSPDGREVIARSLALRASTDWTARRAASARTASAATLSLARARASLAGWAPSVTSRAQSAPTAPTARPRASARTRAPAIL